MKCYASSCSEGGLARIITALKLEIVDGDWSMTVLSSIIKRLCRRWRLIRVLQSRVGIDSLLVDTKWTLRSHYQCPNATESGHGLLYPRSPVSQWPARKRLNQWPEGISRTGHSVPRPTFLFVWSGRRVSEAGERDGGSVKGIGSVHTIMKACCC